MIAPPGIDTLRPAFALELALGHGRRIAGARLELLDAAAGSGRVARVTLRGWIDRAARRRLAQALEVLDGHAIERIVFDCSQARCFGGYAAHEWLGAVAWVGAAGPGVEFLGLPRRQARRTVPGERAS